MTTQSNLKRRETCHYEVQRQTRSGKWVRLHPPRQFGCGNHGLGLRFLREWVWSLEHRAWPWKKVSHPQGKLRVVKVKTITTEQKFYTPTDLKARRS